MYSSRQHRNHSRCCSNHGQKSQPLQGLLPACYNPRAVSLIPWNQAHVSYNSARAGISASNRQRLAVLHRKMSAPFTVAEAAAALDMDPQASRRFLAYLAGRGWLARLRRDLYVTVPLEATVPSEWHEDPWIIAAVTFKPCYIGGWSACEHWDLTEQIFRDMLVFSARPVRDRRPSIQGTNFRVKVVPEDRLFGTRTVWRRQAPVQVSDPSRTVADILSDPSLGGGIRHVAEVVTTYIQGPLRDDALLMKYAGRLDNRTLYKRLGYLLEASGVDAPELTRACLEEQSSGFSVLDPALPSEGPILRRWNLRVNAHIASSRDAA